MSISLPLSKEVQKATSGVVGSSNVKENLSVERCLRHFTVPEVLADPVDCPNCGRKTPTKKQHVVSKLPKVLCLHLKRFDAAQNKKIEDFVSFPSKGLNMGPYLPHWCEVSRVPSAMEALYSFEFPTSRRRFLVEVSLFLLASACLLDKTFQSPPARIASLLRQLLRFVNECGLGGVRHLFEEAARQEMPSGHAAKPLSSL